MFIGLYFVVITGYVYLTQKVVNTDAQAARTQLSFSKNHYPVSSPQPRSSLTPSALPTAIPSHIPTISAVVSMVIQPSVSPTPTNIPTTVPEPTKLPVQMTTSGLYINLVNDYRRNKGLSEVTEDPYTCSFAQERAQQIATDFSHAVFERKLADHSFAYPSFSKVTENIAQTSSSNPVEMWINSPIHAANMEQNTLYVCIRASGDYYAYEGWSP